MTSPDPPATPNDEELSMAAALGRLGLPPGQTYTEDDLRTFVQLGALSAKIAHKIRNPLAGISATAEVLQSLLPNDERAEFIDVILEEVEKAEKTISDLLTFARHQEAYTIPLHLGQALDRALATMEKHFNAKGISIERDYALDERMALADGELLHKSMLALLANALEAMTDGGTLRLRVHTDAHEADGEQWMQLDIADNGSGIASQHLDQLFDPFFSTKANGIGLGLPMAKRLIDGQGGKIDVVSWEGEGSVFTISLPAVPAEAEGGENL